MRAVFTAFPILLLSALGPVAASFTSKYLSQCESSAELYCPLPSRTDPRYIERRAIRRMDLFICLAIEWVGDDSNGDCFNGCRMDIKGKGADDYCRNSCGAGMDAHGHFRMYGQCPST
ncbi:hypothetical protein A4X13_0g7321 [Tilletia indica]|uniref:Uncharacterized protein n=1 Tax=Tilletia indica TaxID=43049 RepID=A0A177T7N0_9BASI|nr:hypothetical protein A4X13_0g7321 [Tilletia indica]